MTSQRRFLIGGAGGQGVLCMGLALAHGAVLCGLETSWLPSYGAEQRGGTATAMVVVARTCVVSPYVSRPDAAAFLNGASYARFAARVRPGGVILYDSTLLGGEAGLPGVRQVGVPAREIAARLGEERAANMVLLGALLVLVPAVPPEVVTKALPLALPDRHHGLLAVNEQALLAGAEAASRLAARG